MPYRDSARALSERYEALERELSASRERTQSLEQLRAQETRIAAELAEIARKLAELQSRRARLPLLSNVAIASPCTASWEKMQGDLRVRFCGECQKNVYNLSAMAREDAENLLRSRPDGDLCVRLYQREDGTVLTQDCPVGVTRKRRRKLAFGIAGATALTAAAVMSALKYGITERCGVTPRDVRMGAPAPMVIGSVAPIEVQPPKDAVTPKDVTPPGTRTLMGGPTVPHPKMGRVKTAPDRE
jgi:hypothetical protein